MSSYSTDIIARFWSYVDKTPNLENHWLWKGTILKDGYGQFHVTRRVRKLAHRFAYELLHGTIPPKLCVLHKPPCVVRNCVFHTYIGTHKDNTADMLALNRANPPRGDNHPLHLHPELAARGDNHWTHLYPEKTPKGMKNGYAKLTEEIVLAIRAMFATGQYTQQTIALLFDIPFQNINQIVLRKRWKHI